MNTHTHYLIARWLFNARWKSISPQDIQQIKATNCNCGLFYLFHFYPSRSHPQLFQASGPQTMQPSFGWFYINFDLTSEIKANPHSHKISLHRRIVWTGNNIPFTKHKQKRWCRRQKSAAQSMFHRIAATAAQRKTTAKSNHWNEKKPKKKKKFWREMICVSIFFFLSFFPVSMFFLSFFTCAKQWQCGIKQSLSML